MSTKQKVTTETKFGTCPACFKGIQANLTGYYTAEVNPEKFGQFLVTPRMTVTGVEITHKCSRAL